MNKETCQLNTIAQNVIIQNMIKIFHNLTMDYEILMRMKNDYDLNIKLGHNAC